MAMGFDDGLARPNRHNRFSESQLRQHAFFAKGRGLIQDAKQADNVSSARNDVRISMGCRD